MVDETKYGIISDVHLDPRIVPIAIKVLKSLGAQKLVVNGDIGVHKETLKESQDYTAFILDAIGKSDLESFVQPGSHESLLSYSSVLEYFVKKYPNIIDVINNQKLETGNHHLVFLPGSDFTCGGEFQIGNSGILPSGRYIQTKPFQGEELVRFEQLEEYVNFMNAGIVEKVVQYANMQDLRKLITEPEKTIVICHIPRKFNGLETCVDMAEFGEATKDFCLEGENIETGFVIPMQFASQLVKRGCPIKIRRENRGNEDLKGLYEELDIRKSVSGHFHESTHRANDRNGNHVEEGIFVDELFWNSGHLDIGHAGILTVDYNKVKYQNVRLKEYLS